MKKYINNFIREEKGVITVWLTLLLVCMVSFVVLIIECVRYNLSKSVCMQNGHLATISSMADYEPDIYDNYHIFALDITYGDDLSKKEKLKDNISMYANMSIDPDYLDVTEGLKNMLGCSVDKVSLSNIKCWKDDNSNFINQVCSYMKENYSELDVSTLSNKNILCWYIMNHFSSYKSTYILGYMKRKNIYEVEYILNGKDSDNENIELVMDLFDKSDIDEDAKEIVCDENIYREVLYRELLKRDMEVLCSRAKEVLIRNINETYKKNIQQNNLVSSVDVEIEYGIEQRATKIQLINQWFSKKYNNQKLLYNEKIEY